MRVLSISCTTVFIATCLLMRTVYASPDNTPTPSDQEIDARLHEVNQSLQAQETYAEYWEYGWGGFDGGTMLWSAAQADQDHNRKDRNADIVQAAESLIGLTDVVLRPLPAFYADSVCEDPALTKQDQLQCLAAREALLERSAERAREPYEILPHLGNFGFNLLAGLIVWRAADSRHALLTAVPGEIIGEMQIWTTPRQPLEDFTQYKLQFGPLLVQTEHSRSPAAGAMVSLHF